MKIKTTVSKIEIKFNVKIDLSEKIPMIQIGKAQVELYRNGEENLAFVIVRRVGDDDDTMSDYYGGIYCRTIKDAIHYLEYYNR